MRSQYRMWSLHWDALAAEPYTWDSVWALSLLNGKVGINKLNPDNLFPNKASINAAG
jgi:hypothetical protein